MGKLEISPLRLKKIATDGSFVPKLYVETMSAQGQDCKLYNTPIDTNLSNPEVSSKCSESQAEDATFVSEN